MIRVEIRDDHGFHDLGRWAFEELPHPGDSIVLRGGETVLYTSLSVEHWPVDGPVFEDAKSPLEHRIVMRVQREGNLD